MSQHSYPRPRKVGTVNWIGMRTLYEREVWRFIKVHQQTVWAPVVTTMLYYAVFALALGAAVRTVAGVPFLEFLAPGLIMMSMAQNSFANTSSSVMIAKIQGNIVDILMPPLSASELVAAYVAGGVTRGICVGLATALTMWMFVPIRVLHLEFVLFHGVMASMLLALLGLIGGIWSEKFDHIAAVTNFVVMPLSFLSGTFYSVASLPPVFWWIAHFDPFFYMIDGFRYGFIGQSDGTLVLGIFVMLGVNLVLWLVAWRMLRTGYRLKA